MAFGLCKYKNILGEPNTGIRKYRIFDIALFDTLVVILFGILISYTTGYKLWMVLVVLFISGIIAHRLFCVRSGVDKLLFS
jgi:uncharacterized membrane protein